MNKKIIRSLLLLTSAICVSGCSFNTSSSEGENENPEKEFDMKLVEDSKSSKIVKDYTYMYHLDGLKDSEKDRLAFFSDNYQMMINARNAKLLGIKAVNEEKMVNPDDLSIIDSKFEIEINNSTHEITENGEGRLIDSGRYVNRYDNVTLPFDGLDNNYFGRVEYVANRDFIVFNYELYSLLNPQFKLKASFNLNGYELSKIDNRSYMAKNSDGSGFIFAKQSTNDEVEISISGSELIISKSISDYSAKQFKGLGIVIIPFYHENYDCFDCFLANENIEISAQIKNGKSLEVNYDPTDGVHYIDHNEVIAYGNSNTYDDIHFEINNNCSVDVKPILCFTKSTNLSITGVSPMIVDSETYEPTGETVQISKNWHTYSNNKSDFNYADTNSSKRYYQGPWLHAYSRIMVEHDKTECRDYMLAYGRFGETFAVSHSQLCLVGYTALQIWDQSALGSWGESITYDPDMCCNRAMVDDVRPFLVTGPTGGNMQYNWTGNIGGADFLRYADADGSYRIINQRLSYLTQAPCVTNVNYSGNTSDGKIKTSITINMGRTDDIPRAYYTLEYEFLDDVEYSELTFFKLCANSYADNKFTKFAYGDINGIKEKDLAIDYQTDDDVHNAEDSDFFFGLYNSTDPEENGDVMLCVREYDADINGVKYDKPGYKFANTTNYGINQKACEIVLPSECNNIVKKGSKVKLVVEYDVLPNSSTYYGPSNYINQTKDLMGTADEFYQQVFGGKLDLNVLDGVLVSTYPINIYSKGNEVVSFKLSGGLGYTQLLLDGLSSYKGYKLQMKVNGEFQDIDQSSEKYDTDFYQVCYNERTNKYQFGYNIFNTKGTNFAGSTNEYRLIKVNK